MERTLITRRRLLSGAAGTFGATFWLPKFSALAATVREVRAGMVDRARYYLGTTDWAPREPLIGIGKSFYCNVFVADVAADVDGRTWDMIPGRFGLLNEHDPLAADWANPDFVIKGWAVIFHPKMASNDMSSSDIYAFRQPGDVISGGGHVGIMSDDSTYASRLVFSAAADTGKVVLNEWSFRPPSSRCCRTASEYNQNARKKAAEFTVRRFTGT